MKCPGQDTRFWRPGAIFEANCPNCGQTIEFFKDETGRKCPRCGQRTVNPKMDFGCASYCKFAEQCLGDLPPELLAKREELLKDRVAIEMKRVLRKDFKKIAHAINVARHAEEIVREEGGDPAVVLTAAYLRPIAAPEATRTSADAAGAVDAREILSRVGAREELIEEVCAVISPGRDPEKQGTLNLEILRDAERLVNLEEGQKESPMPAEKISSVIDIDFSTETAKRIARRSLLGDAQEAPSEARR
jgi:hypothetical protein